MTRLDSNAAVIDFQSVARARKVRFIIAALEASVRTRGPATPEAMLREARALTLDGRLLVESHAHLLMKTKHPRAASETTWAQVMDELEARADVDEAEGER